MTAAFLHEEHGASAECYDAGCIDMPCRLAKVAALKGPVPDLRTLAAVSLVEPGCLVYSAEREYFQGSEAYPRGGVVVEITDGVVDEDTGERPRSFRCLRVKFGKVHAELVSEAEVDRAKLLAPEDSEMRYLVRVAARELAQGKGVFTTRHAELAKWIFVLTALVMGRR